MPQSSLSLGATTLANFRPSLSLSIYGGCVPLFASSRFKILCCRWVDRALRCCTTSSSKLSKN